MKKLNYVAVVTCGICLFFAGRLALKRANRLAYRRQVIRQRLEEIGALAKAECTPLAFRSAHM